MSEFVGDAAWLHATSTDFRIVLTVTKVKHTAHFSLADATEVQAYIATRAYARIVGPLRISIVGPFAADKATNSAAVIAPTTFKDWPKDVDTLCKAPHTVELVSSLYSSVQNQPLHFHPAISTQLKPAPIAQHLPELVYAYNIAGGAATSTVRIEVSGTLELAGVDYPCPWTTE